MAGLLHRKVVADAMLACLSAGFNETVADLAAEYETETISLDFSSESKNVVLRRVNPAQLEISGLVEFPGMAIYTEDVRDGYPNIVKGMRFCGEVTGAVEIFLLTREGAEEADVERQIDIIEDAVLGLYSAYTWPVSSAASVVYSRQSVSSRGEFMELADGYAQSITISARFGVSIP